MNSDNTLIKQRAVSTAVLAALSFVGVNYALGASLRLVNPDRFQMQTHNWAWWATKALLEHNQPVDVLLMGSSLVQRVVDDGDATYLNRPLDARFHRNSCMLEEKLSALWHRPVRTWSYAVGGLHASDAAIVTKTLIRGEHQPGAIVYGIAPRDLMNNLLAAPCATETFKLMSHLADQSDVAYQARTTNGEKLDYVVSTTFEKTLPLYAYRSELAQVFRRRVKQEVSELADSHLGGSNAAQQLDLAERIKLQMMPEECDNELLTLPYNRSASASEDSKNSYLCCYRPFRPKFYNAQKYFLEAMLKTCSDRGIQVVFVNMPLRKDNFDVMEPGFYERYLRDLRGLASRYQASVVDMNRQDLFSDRDFSDQVHLTGDGAIKLVTLSSPALGQVLHKPSFAMNGGTAK
ncbi:MAG TPA: DUF1574 family protein [Oculatellaceae cyanobacterium]